MSQKRAQEESHDDDVKSKKVKADNFEGKRVLLLGCGLVAPPFIKYLGEHGYHVTVASRTLEKTKEVIKNIPNTEAVVLDVEADGAWDVLDKLTPDADVVVSLLPYIHHVEAAKIALKYKKHFCTTSYVSEGMKALGPEAEKLGVILLNECGVDPGLDHMSAQKIIDEAHAEGGKVVYFTSICGGLPAPQDNNNPWGYKLSWSPRGVLLAGRNDATFYEDGKKVSVPGKNLYDKETYRVETIEGLDYEWYPNRDSTQYAEIYKIPEAKTLIRGTYRNAGWCETLKVLAAHSFNSTEKKDYTGVSYAKFTVEHLGGSEEDVADAKAFAIKQLNLDENHHIIKKFEWLGLFDAKTHIPSKVDTPLDAVCHLMQAKMQYAEGEKDMLLMKHTFQIEYPDGKVKKLTSTMLDYGHQPHGYSSMARTVSLPVAVAVRAILDGRLKGKGLIRPIEPEIYNLVLKEMDDLGVKFVEKEE